jgi:hypothetical protein
MKYYIDFTMVNLQNLFIRALKRFSYNFNRVLKCYLTALKCQNTSFITKLFIYSQSYLLIAIILAFLSHHKYQL